MGSGGAVSNRGRAKRRGRPMGAGGAVRAANGRCRWPEVTRAPPPAAAAAARLLGAAGGLIWGAPPPPRHCPLDGGARHHRRGVGVPRSPPPPSPPGAAFGLVPPPAGSAAPRPGWFWRERGSLRFARLRLPCHPGKPPAPLSPEDETLGKRRDDTFHRDQSPQFLSPAGQARRHHPSSGLVVATGRTRIKPPAKSLKRGGFTSTPVPGAFAVGFSSEFWVGLLVLINPGGCPRAAPAPEGLPGMVPWQEGCRCSGCHCCSRSSSSPSEGAGPALAARPRQLLPLPDTPVCSFSVISRVTHRKVFYLHPVLC
ncbi:uncharacterized protein WM294_015358 [Sarcoramphus papa]